MKRIMSIGLLGLVFLIAAAFSFEKTQESSSPLGKIHQKIVSDYPDMPHISRAELDKNLTSQEFLILDTRPIEEYNVSHIATALQVDPDISPEDFRLKFSKTLKNKRVILYCSVGRRSSNLGDRLKSTALNAGAISVQNMEGGLFGWHNDSRPLVNASGTTSSIHPYNVYWGRLIENKDDIRYRP